MYFREALVKQSDDNNILDEQYLSSVLYKNFTERADYNIEVFLIFILFKYLIF